MPCHVPATSPSSKRRSPSLSYASPTPAARLDLSRPGERAAHDLIHRFSTGRWPIWRLLGLRRRGQALVIAVEWRRSRSERFAVVEVSLGEVALRWQYHPSSAEAVAALGRDDRSELERATTDKRPSSRRAMEAA